MVVRHKRLSMRPTACLSGSMGRKASFMYGPVWALIRGGLFCTAQGGAGTKTKNYSTDAQTYIRRSVRFENVKLLVHFLLITDFKYIYEELYLLPPRTFLIFLPLAGCDQNPDVSQSSQPDSDWWTNQSDVDLQVTATPSSQSPLHISNQSAFPYCCSSECTLFYTIKHLSLYNGTNILQKNQTFQTQKLLPMFPASFLCILRSNSAEDFQPVRKLTWNGPHNTLKVFFCATFQCMGSNFFGALQTIFDSSPELQFCVYFPNIQVLSGFWRVKL